MGEGGREDFDDVAGLEGVAGHPNAAAVDEHEAVVDEGLGGAAGEGGVGGDEVVEEKHPVAGGAGEFGQGRERHGEVIPPRRENRRKRRKC